MGYVTPSSTRGTVARFFQTHDQKCFTLHPNDSVLEAATGFTGTSNGRKHSLAVVVDDSNHVVGVLSLGDIALALSQYKAEVVSKTVEQIMTREVSSAQPDDDLSEIMERMSQRNIRHMPVILDGVLQGIITRKDALEGLYRDTALELKSVTEFVFRSGARY